MARPRCLDAPVDRTWYKIAQLPNGCWLYTGHSTDQGYGVIRVWVDGHYRSYPVHRLVYEALVGPIPEGLEPDHLCRNRACCNPAHLEPVTHRENILRGGGPIPAYARRTHCSRGHEFTPENTSVHHGARRCRACHRMDSARRQRLFRESQPVGAT